MAAAQTDRFLMIATLRRLGIPAAAICKKIYARVLLFWMIGSTLLLCMVSPIVQQNMFPDVDDALRLVQVRDLIAGQDWFDLHQYRINPPSGVLMHWSRIVDLPLAATIQILRPLLGNDIAELIAVLFIPIFLLLITMLLVRKIGSLLSSPDTGMIAVLLIFLVSPAMLHFAPLRIDHHGWLILLNVLALKFLFSHKNWLGGFGAGFSVAASLSISLETLPLAAVFGAVCTLRLLRGEQGWLGGYSSSLCFCSIALFFGTRGFGELSSHCDAMSPGYLSSLLCAACGSLISEAVFLRARLQRVLVTLFVLLLTAASGVLVIAILAPSCLSRGAFGDLDPLVLTMWYNRVYEGLPVWRQELGIAALYTLFPIVGFILALQSAFRVPNSTADRQRWTDFSIILGGATILGMLVSRASATAGIFATVVVAHKIRQINLTNSDEVSLRKRVSKLFSIGIISFPAFPILLMNSLFANTKELPVRQCNYSKFMLEFQREQAGVAFAPLDIGPIILERTHHSVVATGHHRGNAAMRDVISTFIGSESNARNIIERHHATWFIACPSAEETKLYLKYAPNGFWAHLVKGDAPRWLKPVAIAPKSGVKVWRVINSDILKSTK